MNATINRNISFRGGRKFVKGERVLVLDVHFLELKWLNETEVTYTVADDEGLGRYAMPVGKVKLDDHVEVPTRYGSA